MFIDVADTEEVEMESVEDGMERMERKLDAIHFFLYLQAIFTVTMAVMCLLAVKGS